MSRKLVTLFIVAVTMVMTTMIVSADSPRFSRVGSSTDSGGNLTVTFRETGLGNTPDPVNYMVSGTASTTYACINGGGNHPKASNKETRSSPISQGASFLPENGVVNGTITVDVPGAGGFACPGGQTLVLVCVTYSGLTLADTDHNVSTAVPGASFSDPVFGQFCR